MADEENTEEPASEPADDAAATKPARPPRERAVVSAGGGGGLAAAAAGTSHAVVVAREAPVGASVPLPRVSRRGVLLTTFWVALTGMLGAIVLTVLTSLYPRQVSRLAGKFVIGDINTLQPGQKQEVLVQVPDKRSPLNSLDAKVYLVRLNEEQAARNPGGQAGMVYAFWRKCPHLGCTVPYSPTFSFEDPRSGQTYPGWFRCPCHGSTYSDSGVKVFGPAPRSLDSFPVTIGSDGKISVDIGVVIPGAAPFSPEESARGVLPA